jgi:antitoxin MazE
MQAVIKKWGNSLALRLPQHIVADLRMMEGATVSLSVENESLIVKATRKHYKLADLLAAHKKEANHAETDWSKPVGEEVW